MECHVPREQQIERLLAALSQRNQVGYQLPPGETEIEALLEVDLAANRRWASRIDWLMRCFGVLGRWLPFHDLELLGQMNFESLAWLCNYNLKHFLVSSAREDRLTHSQNVYRQLSRIRANIPIQTEPYRQQPCTPETALQRALYCLGDLSPSGRILLLGDDDLTSVALALVAKERQLDIELTVVDIDTRLLDAVSAAIRPLGIKLEAKRVDLFGHGHDLHNRFDLVLADPSYEETWVRQFADVAFGALEMGGHYLLSLPHPIGRDWLPRWVSELEQEHPVQMKAFHEAFNEYPMLHNRKRWMRWFFSVWFPVEKTLARQYQSVPFTYSDLLVFQKTSESLPTRPGLPSAMANNS